MDTQKFSQTLAGITKTHERISRTCEVVLSWIAPLVCVVCTGPVEVMSPWPLCSACAAKLNVDGGRRCDICGKPIISELSRCMRCRSTEVSFDVAFPLYSYTGMTQKLLIAYKVKKRRSLANFLAKRLAPEILARFPDYTLVPVPPRPGKLRKEGWDQVELIAKILERRCGLPIARLLVRVKGGDEQKTLDKEGRRINVLGRYALLPRITKLGNSASNDTVPGKVILLDDIMTTGATLSECASVLKANGSDQVCAIVIAAD
ncbi:MAG: ComF family protein [Spirochaetota bacterium]